MRRIPSQPPSGVIKCPRRLLFGQEIPKPLLRRAGLPDARFPFLRITHPAHPDVARHLRRPTCTHTHTRTCKHNHRHSTQHVHVMRNGKWKPELKDDTEAAQLLVARALTSSRG